jgi:hypothetical protein
MDLHYLYAIVSFVVGAAAGYQGISERYNKDATAAAGTSMGVLYLFTRGGVSSIGFIVLYAAGYLHNWLGVFSFVCGTSTEVVLRSTIFVKQAPTPDGHFDELLRGPFDLLKWYQGKFLESIAGQLARKRKSTVRKLLPSGKSFAELMVLFRKNKDAWPDQSAIAKLEVEVARVEAEFNAAQQGDAPPPPDDRYQQKLGYLILNNLGKDGVKTLLSS